MVEKRPSEAVAAAAPPREEDFPRGGGGALTALERRQAREEGRSRAELELNEGPRPSKKRKPSSSIEVHSQKSCVNLMHILLVVSPLSPCRNAIMITQQMSVLHHILDAYILPTGWRRYLLCQGGAARTSPQVCRAAQIQGRRHRAQPAHTAWAACSNIMSSERHHSFAYLS